MKDRGPGKTVVTETIAAWKVVNSKSANAAMSLLAEKYLEDDRFPQGPNEEISLLSSDHQISLNVTRTYGPNELKKIAS